MSSVLRTHAQIPVRAKYLVWGAADISNGAVPVASAFQLSANVYGVAGGVGSMATAAEITDADGYEEVTSFPTNLLKDMGRQITVYHSTSKLHLAVYREVQVVNGSGSEGVGGSSPDWDSTYFVKVWSADGDYVNVTRTG